MTLEKRAQEFTFGKALQSNHRYDKRSTTEGYIQGAIDQKEIDINKAYKIISEVLTNKGFSLIQTSVIAYEVKNHKLWEQEDEK